jgi:GntR family transcriptional regulator/MocR family aminotransferase
MFSGYSPTVSRFEQYTLYRFIEDGYISRHIQRVKNIYKKRRDILISCVRRAIPKARISGDKAGLHLIIDTDGADELVRRAEEAGIKLYRLSDYYAEGGGRSAVVVGYGGMSGEDITKAWDIIGGLMR